MNWLTDSLAPAVGGARPETSFTFGSSGAGTRRAVVCRKLRQEQLDTLPAVVFSRNDDPDVVDERYELGATA